MLVRIADTAAAVVEAMRAAFTGHPEVEVHHGNILQLARCAVVSPANSDGYLDGGLDAELSAFFGQKLDRAVRDAICARPEGRLPIGASLVVPTHHERIPFLVVAPTMDQPGPVVSSHAYRAMRAILRVTGPERLIEEVWIPGLATGVGQVDPIEAAGEMAEAFADWKSSQELSDA